MLRERKALCWLKSSERGEYKIDLGCKIFMERKNGWRQICIVDYPRKLGLFLTEKRLHQNVMVKVRLASCTHSHYAQNRTGLDTQVSYLTSKCATTWPFSPAPDFGFRPGWVWFCRMWQWTLQHSP